MANYAIDYKKKINSRHLLKAESFNLKCFYNVDFIQTNLSLKSSLELRKPL